MTAVKRFRKTLLRKHISKEGIVAETSRPVISKDRLEVDYDSDD